MRFERVDAFKILRTVQSAECDVRVCSGPFKSRDFCV